MRLERIGAARPERASRELERAGTRAAERVVAEDVPGVLPPVHAVARAEVEEARRAAVDRQGPGRAAGRSGDCEHSDGRGGDEQPLHDLARDRHRVTAQPPRDAHDDRRPDEQRHGVDRCVMDANVSRLIVLLDARQRERNQRGADARQGSDRERRERGHALAYEQQPERDRGRRDDEPAPREGQEQRGGAAVDQQQPGEALPGRHPEPEREAPGGDQRESVPVADRAGHAAVEVAERVERRDCFAQ